MMTFCLPALFSQDGTAFYTWVNLSPLTMSASETSGKLSSADLSNSLPPPAHMPPSSFPCTKLIDSGTVPPLSLNSTLDCLTHCQFLNNTSNHTMLSFPTSLTCG